jgi:folate-binding protein YgfZ
MDRENDKIAKGTGFFRWRPAAALRIAGEDSSTFLQGQFTNDLRSSEEVGAVYGLWLNHKGRVIADSFVRRGREGDFWVVSYFCPAAVIRERLEAFIIADDVTIEDVTGEWRGVTLFGDEPAGLMIGLDGGAFSFVGRRTGGAHRELVFPAALEAAVSPRLAGLPEVGAEEMERMRIADRIPAVPMDIGLGELPNEGGLEAAAISYNKGCYLGQEVMARLKSMGQVRRRLLGVEGTGASPSLPAPVFQGDRRIGELRTQVRTADGFEGLALLSLLNLQPDVGLSFSPGAEAVITVIDPA